jgi:hypothetical protein
MSRPAASLLSVSAAAAASVVICCGSLDRSIGSKRLAANPTSASTEVSTAWIAAVDRLDLLFPRGNGCCLPCCEQIEDAVHVTLEAVVVIVEARLERSSFLLVRWWFGNGDVVVGNVTDVVYESRYPRVKPRLLLQGRECCAFSIGPKRQCALLGAHARDFFGGGDARTAAVSHVHLLRFDFAVALAEVRGSILSRDANEVAI